MSIRDSEQQILDAIEAQLRSEDPQLTATFVAFTSITRNAAMPLAELLNDGCQAASPARCRRAGPHEYPLVVKLAALVVAYIMAVLVAAAV